MKKPKPQKKGQPDWLATYADMFTLLMCFFLILFSMADIDEDKFNIVAESFGNSISIFPGSPSLMDGVGPAFLDAQDETHPEASTKDEPDDDPTDIDSTTAQKAVELQQQQNLLGTMAAEFKTYFAENPLGAGTDIGSSTNGSNGGDETTDGTQIEVDVNLDEMYVRITFPGGILFDSGRAVLKTEAIAAIDLAADKMDEYSNHIIRIEGHTDNVPQNSAQFPSNRHLSAARAVAVVEYLVHSRGFDPKALRAEGMSEYWPKEPNNSVENRAKNRRVEIKIYAQVREGEEIIPIS